MSITALEIQQVSFGTAKHGYDPQEVDDFLERVAEDVDTLNRAIAEAAARVKAAEERISAAEERAHKAEEAAKVAPAAQEEPPAHTAAHAAELAISQETISKAFIAAQRSADALQEEARIDAEELYREAEESAKNIVRDAHSEKQQILGDLENLRGLSEKFRTDFLSLLNHYSTDATKRFDAFSKVIPDTELPASFAKAVASVPAEPPASTPRSRRKVEGKAATKEPTPDTGLTTIIDRLAPLKDAGSTGLLEEDDDLDIEEID